MIFLVLEIAIKITKDDENENILSTNEKTVEEQKLIDKPSHLVDKFLSNSINNSSKQINNNKLFERIDTNFLSSAFGSVTTIKSIGNKQSTNARTVLWYLVFLGFAVNYMLRININIAIVDMNSVKKTTNNNHHRSECFANVDHINIGDANANGTVLSLLKTNLTESKKYLISELGPNEITYSTEQSILNYFDVSIYDAFEQFLNNKLEFFLFQTRLILIAMELIGMNCNKVVYLVLIFGYIGFYKSQVEYSHNDMERN